MNLSRIKNKDYRAAVRSLCERFDLSAETTTKGYKLKTTDGRVVACTHSTPSDRRTIQNLCADVCRKMREFGGGCEENMRGVRPGI